ncbi:hypothetical protein BU24DRAFT_398841 [Aaosphaeria arxii CBS 175.79]|uniref:Uncharacterized protein n=1 Tax=Aaosphaeria arxii CBS 175.79 TaxID=1450172 RepID=A0A6A5XDE1_9PLEO|nr:uncharacterized protein BU24DRAFT_398841 [Aaosphaeria arxii CBS 175.79]KAF2010826.1 hypothetical protein BU24DRAFT_398841 [Aaosphaeria arxii CBS 175.79]
MSQITPQRIILSCREQYYNDWETLLDAFFELQNLKNLNDYMINICRFDSAPYVFYIVVDVYCHTVPVVELPRLKLRVFKVANPGKYRFIDLGESASNQARERSLQLEWGERMGPWNNLPSKA